MKKFFLGFVFTIAIVGCGVQTDITPDVPVDAFTTVPASERMKEIAARTVPDARALFAGNEAAGLQPLALGPNLFSNAGFESGLTGWTGCEAGAIQTSSDSFAGSSALQVNPNNCFYRSAEISVGQELVLSCYIKVRSGSGWTGMGMGFGDANFNTLQDAPTVVATSNSYVRYETRGTAPANSKFLSMWIFSENDVVVDNCSLAVDTDTPSPPSGDNLLENGMFEALSAANTPTEWIKGCSGSWGSVSGRSGRGMSVAGGACVDQSLSAAEASSLSGSAYSYSCYTKHTSGYASISLFLNGQASSKVIPVSNSYQRIEISGTGPASTSNGFVSIYSEGNTVIDDCVLTSDTAPPPPPPPSGDNLLSNGGFEVLNAANQPAPWVRGCGGTWASTTGRSGRGLNISGGACVDQSLGAQTAASLSGETYSYSCYVRNPGGYASMSIFLNGQAMSTVIPTSTSFQRVELTGNAPASVQNAFVSIYSEGGITVDDCVLGTDGITPPPPSTCSGNATYVFTFTNSWTASTHPYQFTDDPHFSDFVGTNHGDNYSLWETGSIASQGIQNVAELGSIVPLDFELNSAISQGNAENFILGDFLNPALAGSQRSFTIAVSPEYSQLSLVSMLAPSPDWFIGLSGLELCQNGQWIESVNRDAFVYDSGTDDGVIYDSADVVSNPRQVITRLNALPFVVNGQTVPVGTFSLTKN